MVDVDPSLLPKRDGDVPLHALSRDQLSALLYFAFRGDELLRLLREAKVAMTGGYRIESIDDLARADLLADEIRAAPASARFVAALLREIYEFPALEAVVLPKVVAEELAALAVEPDASLRLIWRLLADPAQEIRGAAAIALEALADEFFGPPGEGPPGEAPAPQAPAPTESEAARALRKEAKRAGAQAERAREKVGNLKEQLRDVRSELGQAQREASAKSKESAKLAAELERVREKLEKARQKGKADELERLTKERAELAARVATLEEKVRAAAEARAALAEELVAAKRQLEQRARPEPVKTEEPESPADEALPANWLFPRYTREFYDSLEGWDPRIQRAAFKQANLLAENHRHPSLRAIPLEGLPGYYRVRIATDVRLIYRRSENEREVELLSLIDREDLDRYVRQAKTR